MRRKSEERFVRDLRRLLEENISIFGLKLTDDIHNIICTRTVPISLNVAGREYKFVVFWADDSFDVILDEAAPEELARMELPKMTRLIHAADFVKSFLSKKERSKFSDFEGEILQLAELEELLQSNSILSYELSKDMCETTVYVELSVDVMEALQAVYAISGVPCDKERAVLRMVFTDLEFTSGHLQFSPDLGQIIKESKKNFLLPEFNGMSSYVTSVSACIGDVINRIAEKFEIRKKVLINLFSILEPMDLVLGVDSQKMSEMTVALGPERILKISLKETFPEALPSLVVFRQEHDPFSVGNPFVIKKEEAKKGDVFGAEKDEDLIVHRIIDFICAQILK